MYRDLTAATWDCVNTIVRTDPPPGWNFASLFSAKAHPVFVTRESIVEQVLLAEKTEKRQYEVLLWMDSDCGFVDAAHAWALAERLSAAPPSVGILGVPCRMRGFDPRQANVSHFPGSQSYAVDGVVLPSQERAASFDSPFILAEAVGFGVVAMRGEIFRRLKKPWFEFVWNHDAPQELSADKRAVGEDIGFCRRLRKELGLQTAVDYGITAWHLVEDQAVFPEGALFPFNPEATWRKA